MLNQIKIHKQAWIWLVVFSILWFGLAWWMSNEQTRQSYQDICWANYGQSESYRLCMNGFDKQKAYYEKVKIGSVATAVIGAILLVISSADKKRIVIKKKESKRKKIK